MACGRVCKCGVRIVDCDWPFDVCQSCFAGQRDRKDNDKCKDNKTNDKKKVVQHGGNGR